MMALWSWFTDSPPKGPEDAEARLLRLEADLDILRGRLVLQRNAIMDLAARVEALEGKR